MSAPITTPELVLPPYPVQNALTKGIRAAAREQDRPEFMSLWAGQAARLSRPATAAGIVSSVIDETDIVLRRLAQRSR